MATSKRYSEYCDRVAADKVADTPQIPCAFPQQAYGLKVWLDTVTNRGTEFT